MLTEASDRIGQHPGPPTLTLPRSLRVTLEPSCEIVVKSVDAVRNPLDEKLALTDSALKEAVSEEAPLITVDLTLAP